MQHLSNHVDVVSDVAYYISDNSAELASQLAKQKYKLTKVETIRA